VWAAGLHGATTVAAAEWCNQHASQDVRQVKRQVAAHLQEVRRLSAGLRADRAALAGQQLCDGVLGGVSAAAFERLRAAEQMAWCLRALVVLEALAEEARLPRALSGAVVDAVAAVLAPAHLQARVCVAMTTLVLHAEQAFILGAYYQSR
jgi:hypothetical protein